MTTRTRTLVTKVTDLLIRSDAQGAASISTYIEACEVLHAGYSQAQHGRVEDYMGVISEAAEKMGRARSRDTFFNAWKVGLALQDGRVKREQLLACTSRNEIMRTIPSKKPRRLKPAQWTTVRVSLPVHDQLFALAQRRGETINEVVERLLAQQPQQRKAA